MSENLLLNFECDDFFKAFAVSFCRAAIETPELLLKVYEDQGLVGYKELFEEFKDMSDSDYALQNINNYAKEYNWETIEKTCSKWGEYGWIANPHIVPFGFWGNFPNSQVEADQLVMRAIDKKQLFKLKSELFELTNDSRIFTEAMLCFENKCYTACASLLIALIDGELIRSSYLSNENKKTGARASKRVVEKVAKDEQYGLPGLFYLELLNYQMFINILFERANDFKKEPRHINRNYLHHGMSKRNVLKRDCIKLLLAYRQTLYYSKCLK